MDAKERKEYAAVGATPYDIEPTRKYHVVVDSEHSELFALASVPARGVHRARAPPMAL